MCSESINLIININEIWPLNRPEGLCMKGTVFAVALNHRSQLDARQEASGLLYCAA